MNTEIFVSKSSQHTEVTANGETASYTKAPALVATRPLTPMVSASVCPSQCPEAHRTSLQI